MSLVQPRGLRAAFLGTAAILVALVLAARVPARARAEGWYETYCYSERMAGKSYCVGAVEGPLFQLTGETSSNIAICVAPATYSGGKFSWPYGWDCGTGGVSWDFSEINAHPALDNPNSITIGAYGYAFYR